jgi:hypothetical protein
MKDIVPCHVKQVPKRLRVKAAQEAVKVNPANHPGGLRLSALGLGPRPSPARLALVISRRWPAEGARLTTSFFDRPSPRLKRMVLDHLNAWGERANVEFVEAPRGVVRVAMWGGAWGGYWSYLGTDALLIPPDEPTLNLEGFSEETPEAEFRRVVRHEAGHALGFPHEHMRRTLVSRLNAKKVIDYFMATQGWSEEEVRRQVLTPLEAVSLKRSYRVDERSIMAYRIPGFLTKSGRPIAGGSDITEADYKFAASMYPKPPAAALASRTGVRVIPPAA